MRSTGLLGTYATRVNTISLPFGHDVCQSWAPIFASFDGAFDGDVVLFVLMFDFLPNYCSDLTSHEENVMKESLVSRVAPVCLIACHLS